MPYASLVAELSLKMDRFEQALDLADQQGRTFVRTPLVQTLRLNTKAFKTDLGELTKAFNKTLTVNVDVAMRVNGQAAVIEQSKIAANAVKGQEVALRNLQSALTALDRKGYEAFAGTLRGANDTGAALDRARAKLAEIGRVKPPSSAWSVSVGDFSKIKAAQADLQRLGASLQQDAKFTADFNSHLSKMQGLISGAAAKGEKLGTQIANRLLAASKSATDANRSLGSFGQGLGSLSAIGGTVSRTFLRLANNVRRFAMTHLLMPLLYKAFGALKEATLGYNITIERTTTSLTAMLGHNKLAANALLDQLEQFAVRTPFKFDDLAALTPTLLAAKIQSKDVITTFRALGDAAAVKGGGEGVKKMANDLLSLSARGKVTGMDIRNFASYGVNIVDHLAKAYSTILPQGTKEATLAMRSMITKGLIPSAQGIKAIVAGIENSNIGGLMQKQSRTFEGAMSNIGDAIKIALGKKVFGDTFQWLTDQALQFVNVVSSPAFLSWATAMGPKVKSAFQTVAGAFGAVLNIGIKASAVLSAVFENIKPSIVAASQKLVALFNTVAPVAVKAAAIIGGAFLTVFPLLARGFGVLLEVATKTFKHVVDTVVIFANTVETVAPIVVGSFALMFATTGAVRLASALKTGVLWVQLYGVSSLKAGLSSLKGGMAAAAGWAAANAALLAGVAIVAAFVLAYRKFEWVQKITEDTVLNILLLMKNLVHGITWAIGQISNLFGRLVKIFVLPTFVLDHAGKWGKSLKEWRDNTVSALSLENLEVKSDSFFDGMIDGWIRTGSKKFKSFMMGDWLKDATGGSGLSNIFKNAGFKMPDLSALTKGLGELPPMPKYDKGDLLTPGDKAKQAAAKLAKDRLSNAAALYDAMAAQAKKSYDAQAKAAVDSAKRQIDAFKSVQEKFAGVIGEFQDSLGHYGVFSSALDPVVQKLEELMRFGPRMAQTTKDALGQISDIQRQSAAAQHESLMGALRAKKALDKLNGGDGQEPARAFRAAQLSSGMPSSTAGGAVDNRSFDSVLTKAIIAGVNTPMGSMACARFVSRAFDILGVSSQLKRTDVAARLEKNAIAAGARRIPVYMAGAGDLLVGPGGGPSGRHVGVGVGNGMFAAKNKDRYSKIEGYNFDAAYDTSALAGKGKAIGEKLAAEITRSTKTAIQVGIDESMGQGLVDSLVGALQDLKLSKIAPLPKEFGAPIREAEGHAGRFKIQMLLANEQLQQMLRSMLGDKSLKTAADQLAKNPMVAAPGAVAKTMAAYAASASSQFKDLMRQLGLLGDTFDRTETRLRVRQQTFDLWAKSRMRGKENDPLAQLAFDERPGGLMEYLKPDGRIRAQANQLRANPMVAAPGAAARLEAKFKADGQAERDYIAALRTDATGNVIKYFDDLKKQFSQESDVWGLAKKYIQGVTVDTYGLAKAQAVLAASTAFGNSDQGQTLKNLNSNAFSLFDAGAKRIAGEHFEEGKAEERRQWFVGITTELDKQNKSLQDQFNLSAALGFNETKISDALAMQEDIRKTMSEARFTYGATPEDAERMAKFVADMGQAQRELSRWNEKNADMGKQIQDISARASLNASLRGIYAFTRGGTAAQERDVFLTQKRAELEAQIGKSGGFADMDAVNIQYGIERGKYDESQETNRMAQASLRLEQVKTDLRLQQLSIGRGLSEAAKQQFEWDNSGIKFDEQELTLQKQIIDVLNQKGELQTQEWQKQMNRRLQASGTFDPKKLADLQFQWENMDAGLTDEQINRMLPLDRMVRKIEDFNQRSKALWDQWSGSFQSTMENAATMGKFSINSMLDDMTNSLLKWAADLLSNALLQSVQGVFTKFATGYLGAKTTPLSVPFNPVSYSGIAGGLAAGGHGLFGSTTAGLSSTASLMSTQGAVMMQAARDMSMTSAMRSTSGTGDVHNWNGATIYVASEESIPEAARRQVQRQGGQPVPNASRREVAKQMQRAAGLR